MAYDDSTTKYVVEVYNTMDHDNLWVNSEPAAITINQTGFGMHSLSEIEETKRLIQINGSPEKAGFDRLIKHANIALDKESEAKETLWGYYFYTIPNPDDFDLNDPVELAEYNRLKAKYDDERKEAKKNYGYIQDDTAATYELAMAYKLTGDTRYAEKAIELLNSWATINTGGFKGYEYYGLFEEDHVTPVDPKTPDKAWNYFAQTGADMAMAQYGAMFIQSAILLKDYEGFTQVKKDNFSWWCTNVYRNNTDSILSEFRVARNSSWSESEYFQKIVTANSWLWGNVGDNIRIGVTLHHIWENDTNAIIHEDIPLLKEMLNTQIRDTVHMGTNLTAMMPVEQRRGENGMLYTVDALTWFTAHMQIIYNATGQDLFRWKNKHGYTIEDALDKIFFYAEHPRSWPYRKGGKRIDGVYTGVNATEQIGVPREYETHGDGTQTPLPIGHRDLKPKDMAGILFYSMGKKYSNHQEWLDWESNPDVHIFQRLLGKMRWNLKPLMYIEPTETE